MMEQTQSQSEWVLAQLRSGYALTALDALRSGNIMRLAARIRDLREAGHAISTSERVLPNGKRIAEYRLVMEHAS